MSMFNDVIEGSREKPISLDVFINASKKKMPVIVFCHGYKGFKDWGAWKEVGDMFAKLDFNFIKFNFSYNGTTLESPMDFDDLEAFGNNNYVTELDDLDCVIDWLEQNEGLEKYLDLNEIYLVGHSRGGGIVLLKANEDKRIKQVVVWAGVSDYFIRVPDKEGIDKWKNDGVLYEKNGRTGQDMPVYYQFYESLNENRERLDIKTAVSKLTIPVLGIYGSDDFVVKVKEGEQIMEWAKNGVLKVIEGANHTFGTKHPQKNEDHLDIIKKVVNETVAFLKNE